MANQVTKVDFSPGFVRKLKGITSKKAAERWGRDVKNKSGREARKHYRHAAKQLEAALARGVPGVGTTGTHAVSFRYLEGRGGRYVTPVWAALSDRYRQKSPRSYVFWRKHFTGRPYYGGQRLLVSFARSVRLTTVTTDRFQLKRLRPGVWRSAWDIRFRGLRPPLDIYVTSSLVSGVRHDLSHEGLAGRNFKGLARIQYVEEKRPLIAGMAALLGRDMLRDVRKVVREGGRRPR